MTIVGLVSSDSHAKNPQEHKRRRVPEESSFLLC
jgi:hypothetical protein